MKLQISLAANNPVTASCFLFHSLGVALGTAPALQKFLVLHMLSPRYVHRPYEQCFAISCFIWIFIPSLHNKQEGVSHPHLTVRKQPFWKGKWPPQGNSTTPWDDTGTPFKSQVTSIPTAPHCLLVSLKTFLSDRRRMGRRGVLEMSELETDRDTTRDPWEDMPKFVIFPEILRSSG